MTFTAGDEVSVTVGTRTRSYSVSASQDVTDVAGGLAATINQASSRMEVRAQASGDRVELTQKAPGVAGSTVSYSTSISAGSDPTLRATAAGSTLLESTYPARQEITVQGTPVAGDELRLIVTRLDAVMVTNSVTALAGDSALAVLNRLGGVVNTDPQLTGTNGVWLAMPALTSSTESMGRWGMSWPGTPGGKPIMFNLAIPSTRCPVAR